MKKPKIRLSNRKVIFFNTTRDVYCNCCHDYLVESYVVSAPKGKYRCVTCALKYNIILSVPPEIEMEMKELEEIEVLA